MKDIAGGYLGLFDSNMHDLMGTRAIARRVNVRHRRLHEGVGRDSPVFSFDANLLQAQPRRGRDASERQKNFLRRHSFDLMMMLKNDAFAFSPGKGPLQLRACVEPDALAPKSSFQGRGGVGIAIAQQMFTALDHSNLDIETAKPLGQFRRPVSGRPV